MNPLDNGIKKTLKTAFTTKKVLAVLGVGVIFVTIYQAALYIDNRKKVKLRKIRSIEKNLVDIGAVGSQASWKYAEQRFNEECKVDIFLNVKCISDDKEKK